MTGNVYVYGVAAGPQSTVRGRVPPGLLGATPPRLVAAGEGLWVVAADVPAAQYSAERIERSLKDLDWVSRCALAHEEVVEFFSRNRPLLPVKLFTLFSSEERAVADVRARRADVRRALARVGGREEWGVRVRLSRVPKAPAPKAKNVTGRSFLQSKVGARRAMDEAVRGAHQATRQLFRELEGRCEGALAKEIPAGEAGRRLLLDGVFLVERKRAKGFRALVKRMTNAARKQGLTVQLTGPWPPYHFVGADA